MLSGQLARRLVMTREQLNEFVKSETVKWAQAVKASGAKVD